MTALKYAFVGSRDWHDAATVRRFIDALAPDATVISGGARGVDTIAVEYARERGLHTEVFEADWQAHGRSAGPLRNAEIVAAADVVVAFWDGKSAGTRDTIQRALAAAHVQRVTVVKQESG